MTGFLSVPELPGERLPALAQGLIQAVDVFGQGLPVSTSETAYFL